MNTKNLYAALNELQGNLQKELLAHAAEALDYPPEIRSDLPADLIQTIAAIQAVKDYLVTRC